MKSLVFAPDMATGARVIGYLHNEDYAIARGSKRPCVIICPGGGYDHLSPRESDPPALAFFARGYNAFILNYSVRSAPEQAPLGLTPLRELCKTLAHIRENAEAWHIDVNKLAVMGFSAGGHLCANLGTLWHSEALDIGGDCEAYRPNAMILCYPVLSAGECAHQGSIRNVAGDSHELRALLSAPEQVTENTPPTFLWHTTGDRSVPVENTLMMATALQKHQIPFECHIFPGGAHGMSLCTAETNTRDERCAQWFALCVSWLNELFEFEE